MADEPSLNQRHLVITVDGDDGSVSWDGEDFQPWELVGLLECIKAELTFEFMEQSEEELDP